MPEILRESGSSLRKIPDFLHRRRPGRWIRSPSLSRSMEFLSEKRLSLSNQAVEFARGEAILSNGHV